MLNINKGYNEQLKKTYKSLGDYCKYTGRVRSYTKDMAIEEAVERAITECIEEGILAEFLLKNRAEAKKVSIYEYDEEKHLRMEREQSYVEGMEKGIKHEQCSLVKKLYSKGMNLEQISELIELDKEQVEEMLQTKSNFENNG